MNPKTLFSIVLILVFQQVGFSSYSIEEKFEMLYAAFPEKDPADERQELKRYIQTLHVYDGLSPAKKVKKVFSLTKKKYLQNYSLYSFFPDLWSKGSYNCVTGTALFAIIFDELEIPYSIVEVPEHVYLVAYPKREKIAVESTAEKNGIYTWTENSKIQAVTFLLQIDKVSLEEVKLKGINAIVEEYFYTNAELDFGGLSALHLINRAIYLSDKGNYSGSLACIDKAHETYDGMTLTYVEGGVLAHLLEQTEMENISIIDYVTRYYKICQTNTERKRTLHNFDFFISEALSERKDLAYVDSAEIIIQKNLKDSSASAFLSILHENRAIYYYNRKKFNLAKESVVSAYQFDPLNRSIEDLFGTVMTQYLVETRMETDATADTINSYLELYPFLNESPDFVQFITAFYATVSAEHYLQNRFEQGEDFRIKMEAMFTNPEFEVDAIYDFIGDAYAELSAYYFRQKSYQEALRWIDLALEYDPDSIRYQTKRGYILAYL